ncbi:hypothetical protein BCR34DRAFT_78442 [Clohesyomyces aquaticus]|uniref:Uncharacterized protein n=1 Tax=Clohesyomyces aquaticus TaxID=1231657 RepID=A0A1Y1YZ43_9PLEO|nr:hypothetical protein BCR34DRAFT_78442 [Clohesyomyces aquaticus]
MLIQAAPPKYTVLTPSTNRECRRSGAESGRWSRARADICRRIDHGFACGAHLQLTEQFQSAGLAASPDVFTEFVPIIRPLSAQRCEFCRRWAPQREAL